MNSNALIGARRPVALLTFAAGLFLATTTARGDDGPTTDRLATSEVFEAHNRAREEAELPPLKRAKRLDAAAEAHAKDMAERSEMSHVGSDGSQVADRVGRQDYPYRKVAENVAWGQSTAESVAEAWMESQGHRENILGDYAEVGVAVARTDDGTPYWCVVFGTPWPEFTAEEARDGALLAINTERAREKLPAVKADDRLDKIAADRATELAEHAGEALAERYTPLAESLKKNGYKYKSLMEMAAFGRPGPDDFIKSIRDDPAGLKQLLGTYSEVGVGLARGEGGVPYWALILAEPLKK